MNKLSLMPVGMLLAIAAQPGAATCIATADLGALNWKGTVRVTHQTQPNAGVVTGNLCLQVVNPHGDVLGTTPLCPTLGLNQSVTYSIHEIYEQTHVPFLMSTLSPNLLQVVETDGNMYSHDMQATYGDPLSATKRVPLLFTCTGGDS